MLNICYHIQPLFYSILFILHCRLRHPFRYDKIRVSLFFSVGSKFCSILSGIIAVLFDMIHGNKFSSVLHFDQNGHKRISKWSETFTVKSRDIFFQLEKYLYFFFFFKNIWIIFSQLLGFYSFQNEKKNCSNFKNHSSKENS